MIKQLRKSGPAAIIITCVIICGLAFVFISWWVSNPPKLLTSKIASILSVILFSAVCIRFVPVWIDSWVHPRIDTAPDGTPRYAYLQVLLLFFLALTVNLFLCAYFRLVSGKATDFISALKMYIGLDSNQYLKIAKEGYIHKIGTGEIVELVFLPGYPLLTGILMTIIPNPDLCGFIAAWLPFLLSGVFLYKLFRLDYDHPKTMRILIILCLFPAAFFFALPMSESLFLLCTAACLYCARTNRWLAAGLIGLYACFTRSLGILLLVPMVIELVPRIVNDPERKQHTHRWIRRCLCLLLLPLGTLLYMYINYLVTGNPLAFLYYQKNHWFQEPGYFFATASMQAEYLFNRYFEGNMHYLGLWLPNLVIGFLSLIIMSLKAHKLRPSYTGWFIAYFAVAYGATWLISGPRYMTVCFPLFIAAAELPGRKWIIPAGCGILAILYILCFSYGFGVW